MIGREIKRELQIDQRQILAAAPGQRRADAVKSFGGAGLRRADELGQFLAGLGLPDAFQNQGVPRQFVVERFVHGQRRRIVLVARQPSRIGIGHAKRGIVELVSALKANASLLFPAGEIEQHPRVQVLEDRVPFRTGELVDIGDSPLDLAGAIVGPARQQRRHQIGDGAANGLIDVFPGGGVLLQFEIMNADHQAGDAIGFVDHEDAVGELHGRIDVALRQRRNERTIKKLVVFRVGPQRRAIERRRGPGVAFHAGMARSKIAARPGHDAQIARAGKLCGIGRMVGRLRRQRARQHERGRGSNGDRQAIETN